MARGEASFISLNLRNNKKEKPQVKEDSAFLRKDDTKLEELNDKDLNKLAKGIEARLKAIEQAIRNLDEKEKAATAPTKEKKRGSSGPVLAFVKPEAKEKKMTPEMERRLASLRREKAYQEKNLESRKNKKLDTKDIEPMIQQLTDEISDLEKGIDTSDYLSTFPQG